MMQRKGDGEATCNKCGVVLTETNWSKSAARIGDYRCRDCLRAYNRDYTMRWRCSEGGKRHLTKHERYRQQNYVARRMPDGSRVNVRVVGKRLRPEACEICGSAPKRLVYHHWNDADYSQGLWVCQGCHNVTHTWEDKRPRMMRYRALKQMVGAKPYAEATE